MDVFEWLESNYSAHSGHEPGSEGRGNADEDATSDEDAHVEIGNEIVSLRCPISCLPISTPVRFSGCTHAQCFDQDSWTSLAKSSSRRACPVCYQRINASESLVIDRLMERILEQVPDTVDHILVEPNGEWRTKDEQDGWSKAMSSNNISWVSPNEGETFKGQENASAHTTFENRGARKNHPIVIESDNSDVETRSSKMNTENYTTGHPRLKPERSKISSTDIKYEQVD